MLRVAFYSNRVRFDGDFLEKRGLGGSESALINLTTVWKQTFPEDCIVVYNSLERETKEFSGVTYKSVLDFKSECKTFDIDVFITLRDTEPLFEPFIDTKLLLFWSQDDSNEAGIKTIATNKYLQERLDTILVVSNHSYNDIKRIIPTTPLVLLRNGYREDWADDSNMRRDPIAAYNSTPFRGLSILAEVWSEIYWKCMQLGVNPELRVFTGMSLYQLPDRPQEEQIYNTLKQLPKVTFCGAIPQRNLYEELKKVKVLLYPNTFLETSCMAVLEALANGVWVVTSNFGALPEQVVDKRNGFLISGDPNSSEYKKEFVEKAVYSLVHKLEPDSVGLIFSWQEQVCFLRDYICKMLS